MQHHLLSPERDACHSIYIASCKLVIPDDLATVPRRTFPYSLQLRGLSSASTYTLVGIHAAFPEEC